jgi:fumarate hydratase class II
LTMVCAQVIGNDVAITVVECKGITNWMFSNQ